MAGVNSKVTGIFECTRKITQEESHSLKWEDYFMGFAVLSAVRSKDPNYQVGACIVSPQKRILATGYNGFADGNRGSTRSKTGNEKEFSWHADEKAEFVCHAELNAIVNAKTDLTGSTMYVTRFPCVECAKLIVQSKIAKVYYIEAKKAKKRKLGKNRTKTEFQASSKLFKFAGKMNEEQQQEIQQQQGISAEEFAEEYSVDSSLYVSALYGALRKDI